MLNSARHPKAPTTGLTAFLIETNIAIRAMEGEEAVLERLAAYALCSRAVLVTNNPSDFSDIPGLSLANWVA